MKSVYKKQNTIKKYNQLKKKLQYLGVMKVSSQANTTVQLRRKQGSSTPVFCKPELSNDLPVLQSYEMIQAKLGAVYEKLRTLT